MGLISHSSKCITVWPAREEVEHVTKTMHLLAMGPALPGYARELATGRCERCWRNEIESMQWDPIVNSIGQNLAGDDLIKDTA